jgi:hypothetical protein
MGQVVARIELSFDDDDGSIGAFSQPVCSTLESSSFQQTPSLRTPSTTVSSTPLPPSMESPVAKGPGTTPLEFELQVEAFDVVPRRR